MNYKIKNKFFQNPYNSDFIKTLTIEKTRGVDKFYEGGPYYKYTVFDEKNRKLGYAIIYIGDEFVIALDVDKEHRQKGIATYLYNYIEFDLGIKLHPSENLEPYSKLFWENRLKNNLRKNPPDPEILKNIRFEKKRDYNFEPGTLYLRYTIFHKGIPIGAAFIQPGDDFISDISIKKDYQGKGIGTLLYNVIERDLKIILRPIDLNKQFKGPYVASQSEAGKIFWQKRLNSRK